MKERLKILRKELGLNQTEFGAKLNIRQQTIADWERFGTIPESRIQAICQTFHIRREWLVEGVGEMEDKTDEMSQADAYMIVAMDMFAQLDRERQMKVLKYARSLLEKKENGVVEKSQINNGTVGGDMIQG